MYGSQSRGYDASAFPYYDPRGRTQGGDGLRNYYQLERFKAELSNHGHVLDSGLWRYTRHPNYFGDATLWWGVYAIAAVAPVGWLTLLSPALMTFLLMRVSGVTLLEDGLKASKPGYGAYITPTPAFFPWFPRAQ